MEQLETFLVDDGTLDTVIAVVGSKGRKEFRFNLEYDEGMTRADAIIQARKLAEEAYFEDLIS